MSQERNTSDIYDARTLGRPRMYLLGVQHLFAMFGATVLVPLLTGLDVSTTLLFAGIGTLLFHLVSGGKVPAFLGSSFAFLGGYASVKELGMSEGLSEQLSLAYACLGVAVAGLMYFVMAAIIRTFGLKRILRFFPTIVTAPIVISIGLVLSGSAISNCQSDWLLAIVAIASIIASATWGRGIIRIIPVLLGVIVSYGLATCLGRVDFSPLSEAAWVGIPLQADRTALAVLTDGNMGFLFSTIVAILPIAFATIMEHIGDMSAISSTVGKDFLANPGLHRTLTGDGLATIIASLFGAPANTTYGENTGVLNITRVFDPRIIRIAAGLAILLAFCPKFACLIRLMPAATIGGVSLILYGMISAVGLRNLVEEKVDLKAPRNVFVAAVILVLAIGVKYGANDSLAIGPVHVSGLAIAALAGIALNAILPSNLSTEEGKEKSEN